MTSHCLNQCWLTYWCIYASLSQLTNGIGSWALVVRRGEKSIVVSLMAWCRQATRHYLNQCWPRSMLPYGIPRPKWVKLVPIPGINKGNVFTIFTIWNQPFTLWIVFRIYKDIFAISSLFKWYRQLRSILIEGKDKFILHSLYHGCWCPGITKREGISSYGIDLGFVKYSGISTRMINIFQHVKDWDWFHTWHFKL